MNLSKSTCRNFAIGGIVCAGISIVIGGALLDIVGFVIGFIALTSAKKMIAAMPGDAYVENILKLAKIAVVVSLVAFIANILTAVFLTPVLVDQASSMVAKSASTFEEIVQRHKAKHFQRFMATLIRREIRTQT